MPTTFATSIVTPPGQMPCVRMGGGNHRKMLHVDGLFPLVGAVFPRSSRRSGGQLGVARTGDALQTYCTREKPLTPVRLTLTAPLVSSQPPVGVTTGVASTSAEVLTW